MFQYHRDNEILGFTSVFHVEMMRLILQRLTIRLIYNALYGSEIEAFKGEALANTLSPGTEILKELGITVKNLITKLIDIEKQCYKDLPNSGALAPVTNTDKGKELIGVTGNGGVGSLKTTIVL